MPPKQLQDRLEEVATSSDALVTTSNALVISSDAFVTTSNALVTSPFLFMWNSSNAKASFGATG